MIGRQDTKHLMTYWISEIRESVWDYNIAMPLVEIGNASRREEHVCLCWLGWIMMLIVAVGS